MNYDSWKSDNLDDARLYPSCDECGEQAEEMIFAGGNVRCKACDEQLTEDQP